MIDVFKMAIYVGCVQTARRGRRRRWIRPQVNAEIVEALRTIPVDVLVPQIWKKSSTEVRFTSATEDRSSYGGRSSSH